MADEIEAQGVAIVTRGDTKRCSKCVEIKEILDFVADKSSKDGRSTQCRECRRIHYESVKLTDAYRARKTKWKEENREHRLAKGREYQKNNKERVRASTALWNKNNKERVAERAKAWVSANREKRKEIDRRHRAKVKAATPPTPPKPRVIRTAEDLAAAARSATRRWRERNPDRAMVYYTQNRDRILLISKVWRGKNKDQIAARNKEKYSIRKSDRHAAAAEIRRELSKMLGRVVTTRAEARVTGDVRYFLGRACSKGHLADRFTSTSSCVVCQKNATKAWMDANPEKVRAAYERWLIANGEKYRAHKSDYYQANRTKRLVASRAWYAANKESRAVTIKAWRVANPMSLRATKNNYRAKQAVGGKHTADDILFLMNTQSTRCANSWCRKSLKKGYHVDHVMPISRGGSNERRNLALLCAHCNLSKNAKHPIDFAQQNGMLL